MKTETDFVNIMKQEYHRNGIGGAGFLVSIVEWPQGGALAREYGSHSGLFVAMSFFNDDDENDMEYLRAHTGVLNIGQVAEGQIRVFEENAAWRGADRVGPAVVVFYLQRLADEDHYYNDYEPENA